MLTEDSLWESTHYLVHRLLAADPQESIATNAEPVTEQSYRELVDKKQHPRV